MATKRTEAITSKEPLGEDKGPRVQVVAGEVLFCYKKKNFYSESNQSLEQHSQGCGRIPVTAGFQDAFGQGARQSHLHTLFPQKV